MRGFCKVGSFCDRSRISGAVVSPMRQQAPAYAPLGGSARPHSSIYRIRLHARRALSIRPPRKKKARDNRKVSAGKGYSRSEKRVAPGLKKTEQVLAWFNQSTRRLPDDARYRSSHAERPIQAPVQPQAGLQREAASGRRIPRRASSPRGQAFRRRGLTRSSC